MRAIGFIMDGNRRWARERGLPLLAGHQAGYEVMKQSFVWAKNAGIGTVYVYAFSTENWNRAPEEVNYLMDLFRRKLKEDVGFFQENGIRLSFIGQRSRFAPDIAKSMDELERDTAAHTGVHAVIAASYGGRAEIVAAADKLRGSGEPVTEESFAKALWTDGLPDPDLIIRVGGEERLSNFLPWQSAYSELMFLKSYWPDFTEDALKAALDAYAVRERRFGK